MIEKLQVVVVLLFPLQCVLQGLLCINVWCTFCAYDVHKIFYLKLVYTFGCCMYILRRKFNRYRLVLHKDILERVNVYRISISMRVRRRLLS